MDKLGGFRDNISYQGLRAYWEYNSDVLRIYAVVDEDSDDQDTGAEIVWHRLKNLWVVRDRETHRRIETFSAKDPREGVKRALMTLRKRIPRTASLRSAVIRLAHQNPEFREHLVPLLRQAADIWTDQRRSPDGVYYPRSVYDRLPLDMRPFRWATPARGIDGNFPRPWRVSDKDALLRWLQRELNWREMYTDYHPEDRGRQTLWIGLRDNRNREDHGRRLRIIAETLEDERFPFDLSNFSHILLLDDLRKNG